MQGWAYTQSEVMLRDGLILRVRLCRGGLILRVRLSE